MMSSFSDLLLLPALTALMAGPGEKGSMAGVAPAPAAPSGLPAAPRWDAVPHPVAADAARLAFVTAMAGGQAEAWDCDRDCDSSSPRAPSVMVERREAARSAGEGSCRALVVSSGVSAFLSSCGVAMGLTPRWSEFSPSSSSSEAADPPPPCCWN